MKISYLQEWVLVNGLFVVFVYIYTTGSADGYYHLAALGLSHGYALLLLVSSLSSPVIVAGTMLLKNRRKALWYARPVMVFAELLLGAVTIGFCVAHDAMWLAAMLLNPLLWHYRVQRSIQTNRFI